MNERISANIGRQDGPERETHVQAALKRLSGGIDRAEAAAKSLVGRISDILTTCQPTAECLKEKEEVVQLAVYINELADRVEIIGHFLEETKNRVEL